MTDQQIVEKLGLTDVDEATREVLVAQVRSITEKRLIGVVSDILTDEQQQEFEKVSTTGDDEAAWQWLNTNVTNIDELREAVLTDYLAERQ